MSPRPTPPLNTAPYKLGVDQTANRSGLAIVGTAAAMVGLTNPQATLQTNGPSLSGYAASGYLFVDTGSLVFDVVHYTGISGNNFTGCTGGTHTYTVSNASIIQAYVNGPSRRQLVVSVQCQVLVANDVAAFYMLCDTAGTTGFIVDAGGIPTWKAAAQYNDFSTCIVEVDPGAAYAIWNQSSGGSIGVTSWIEVDY